MKNKTGWICPVCGKGLAPWMPFCDCINHKSLSNIDVNHQYIDENHQHIYGRFAKTEQDIDYLNKMQL